MVHPEARPNVVHIRLAEMEHAGKVTAVVTQNIDGLHKKAGSRNVFELHGSVYENFCMGCGRPKPEQNSWKCVCGTVNTGKFCSECGKPRPENTAWTCSCGAVNQGKFCSECGKARN